MISETNFIAAEFVSLIAGKLTALTGTDGFLSVRRAFLTR